MKIETRELKIITEKLLYYLDERQIKEIEFPHDYYWDIQKEELYDSYREPSNFTIGQLSDNWEDLKKLLDRRRDPLFHDFIDLAAVLKAIGQTLIG